MAIARAKAPFHRGAVEMPDKQTIQRARADKRAGKSASTQAGEFVKREIDKIREGEHGAKNAKQAIAIGLAEARRAGVEIPDKRARSKKSKSASKPARKRAASKARPARKASGTKSASTRKAAGTKSASTRKSSPTKARPTRKSSSSCSARSKSSSTRKAPASKRPARRS